jgi:diacylglycerol O-acyltransferase
MSDLTSWGAHRQMNELEASMWRAESHPTNSLQGGILQIFEREPDWSDVRRIHEQATRQFPRFRERVVEPALPFGPPVWVADPLFDLGYHLRRVRLPEPGAKADLLELAQTLGMTPLARNRALWSSTLIEGLEGGCAAYFLTVHHCLMDGNAVMQLLKMLHFGPGSADRPGFTDPPAHVDRPAQTPPQTETQPLGLAVDQAAGRIRQAPGLAVGALRGVAKAISTGPRESLRFAGSVARVLSPPAARSSPWLNTGTRSSWRYGTVECAIADLKAAGTAAGGTLNDAYVAAVLGGVRLYHEALGRATEEMPVNMPVSVRRPGEEGGNRFSAAFLSAPADEPDPSRRIQLLNTAVAKIRQEPALDFFSLVLPVVNRAPAAIMGPLFNSIQDRADLTVSNVAGLRRAVSFSGAQITAMYCFGPLPGTPITTVLCSYTDVAYVGITCDGDVFREPELLFASLGRGFDEVLDLGGARSRHARPEAVNER